MDCASRHRLSVFILNVSFQDRQSLPNPDWNAWFRSLLKVFSYKIPFALLQGLKAHDVPCLNEMCDIELEKLEEKRRKREAADAVMRRKRDEWILRRDKGNRLAADMKRTNQDAFVSNT
jgi:hypothetical protein